ncbi:TIGR03668 family PPOX class F420-dependent oxidoreductase [Halegenticoccus soli]|uniref:TIGR03668 family PPOX class F420-dependent oxidoreductase n=1 Tax=Halegenticoccus soli TaxID=1985678 RepID=UPI000C6D4FD8|nr:TIGR03668 family PPOX class F420-dependent oxidoreductase [Halegenticoccus soli]
MTFNEAERRFLEAMRVARLGTVDPNGRPHVVPICYALVDEQLAFALDEKPKRVAPKDLQRVRNIVARPAVAVVVDRYSEEWSELGWVQIGGTATLVEPDDEDHRGLLRALRAKYEQYAEHALEERPLVRIDPRHVRSWGNLKTSESADE